MDQLQRVNNVLMISPRASTGAGSVTANLDTASLGSLTNAKAIAVEIDVILSSGPTTNAAAGTIKLLESDDTNSSNFATVVANQTVSVAAAGVLSYYIDMRPRKRYLRVSVTDGATTNDVYSFAVIARTRANQEPASTTDLATTAVIV